MSAFSLEGDKSSSVPVVNFLSDMTDKRRAKDECLEQLWPGCDSLLLTQLPPLLTSLFASGLVCNHLPEKQIKACPKTGDPMDSLKPEGFSDILPCVEAKLSLVLNYQTWSSRRIKVCAEAAPAREGNRPEVTFGKDD